MKKLTAALAAVLIGMAAGAAWAETTNFKPANMSGGSPAPEYSKAKEAAKEAAKEKKTREPGFWDKEYERSGFKQTGDMFKKNLASVAGGANGNFFKDEADKYRERHPKAASAKK